MTEVAERLPVPSDRIKGCSVAVVDDEPDDLFMAGFTLETMGFKVTKYNGGAALVEAIRGGKHFDAIVSDVRMPGMDGIAMLNTLRQLGFDIPVIVVSSTAQEDYPTELAPGVAPAGVVGKPYSTEVLGTCVCKVLESTLPPSEN